MTTQKEYLKNYLLSHKWERIPIYKFVNMWIYRYSARLFELKKEWMIIESREETVKHPMFKNQRRVEYRLV